MSRVVVLESERRINGTVSIEHRFYITSDKKSSTRELLDATRSHWGVESMHWLLDISFKEDASRVRKDNAAQNLSMLRRITLNLLKKETTKKTAIKRKRMLAAMNLDYLKIVLAGLELL